jgi:bacteriorhodopsin
MDLVMIITGLLGALTPSRYKWGFFTFGCAALIYIWWILLVKARAGANALGSDVHKAYMGSAAFLAFLWLLYPIAWGVADGGNVISPLKEMVFYGVLDVLAKPVFCAYHIWALRRIPYERFMLSSGKASMGVGAGALATGTAAAMNEKTRPSTASTAPLTGHHTGAATGGTAAGAGAATAGTATSAGDINGGLLNNRHGMVHRNSHRDLAEEGRL